MNEIILLGKKILADESPVIFSYTPDKYWHKYFIPMRGQWHEENGWLIGTERGNFGGILLSREYYDCNVMLSFKGATILPATRDLNAVFCARWDFGKDYLGDSYVCGLNGWYEHKSGIERNPPFSFLNATTTLYKYSPGEAVRVSCGSIDGHCFMTVNGVLVSELIDPNPIKGGHIGFSPYCTMLKITDIEVRKIVWKDYSQEYEPEF